MLPTKATDPQERVLLRVDLRALQLARVVDVDRLPLGEDVERRLAGLAVAVAGVLRAAEREVHLGADRARVDVRDPGLLRSRIARNALFTSRVKIDDESPYLTPFAARTASSKSSTGISAVVGPKISSCAIRIPASTSPKIVGR